MNFRTTLTRSECTEAQIPSPVPRCGTPSPPFQGARAVDQKISTLFLWERRTIEEAAVPIAVGEGIITVRLKPRPDGTFTMDLRGPTLGSRPQSVKLMF